MTMVLSGIFAETVSFSWTENKYSRTSEPVEKSVLITVISENDFDEMIGALNGAEDGKQSSVYVDKKAVKELRKYMQSIATDDNAVFIDTCIEYDYQTVVTIQRVQSNGYVYGYTICLPRTAEQEQNKLVNDIVDEMRTARIVYGLHQLANNFKNITK